MVGPDRRRGDKNSSRQARMTGRYPPGRSRHRCSSAIGRGGLAVLAGTLATLWVVALCAGTAAAQPAATTSTTNSSPVVPCAALPATLHLTDTVVDSATEVAATSTSPGYCDVQLTENNPPSNDQITIGVFLPDDWNGMFQGLGGGGYSGGDPTEVDTSALEEGYATGATDTGHPGSSGSFALNANGTLNWQLIDDFSYLGIHEMTVTAKDVIAVYYGQKPVYSYWNGCSTGGRQGYMEAQRYPTDYNGIYAGSPAINWAQFMVAQMWGEVQMNLAHDFIPECKLEAAQAAAVAQCDALDGVQDGIISDWPDCDFNAKSLIGEVTPCGTITATDANVINKMLEGPRYPDGKFMWYGEMPGTNMTGLNATTTAADGTVSPDPFAISLQHFVYWLTQNPNYNWETMTYPQFVAFFNQSYREFNGVIGTNNPNLTAFKKAGGKLLSWVGSTDQLIYPQGVIGYYQSVLNQMGGQRNVNSFYRFFIAPGAQHCGSGAGPAPTDPFDALVNWVENGVAPTSLAGSTVNSSGTTITRPVCLYGKVATYTGSGSIDDAANFVCKPQKVPEMPSAIPARRQ